MTLARFMHDRAADAAVIRTIQIEEKGGQKTKLRQLEGELIKAAHDGILH